MRRRILLTSIIAIGTVIFGAAPASALSIFGFSLGSAKQAETSQLQLATTQQQESGISDQAATFINDIVDNADENSCLVYADHQYEVCSAYIFNSSMADLVPYYKYATSNNGAIKRFVSYRLDSRYTGQANAVIRNRTATWNSGDNDVDVPRIKILSVNASLATNSATLRTQEWWMVTGTQGQVIYQENGTYHTVTLERMPSYLLHKWVVTSIE